MKIINIWLLIVWMIIVLDFNWMNNWSIPLCHKLLNFLNVIELFKIGYNYSYYIDIIVLECIFLINSFTFRNARINYMFCVKGKYLKSERFINHYYKFWIVNIYNILPIRFIK